MQKTGVIKLGDYRLLCPECGRTFEDNYENKCTGGCSSLLKSVYTQKNLKVRNLPGMFKYHDWLPVNGYLDIKSAPVTFKSPELSKELGISNLYVTFNGCLPGKNAEIKTCSFKELEAVPTMLRMQESRDKNIILVSSAGNTGRAFCEISAQTGIVAVVVVVKSALDNIWTTKEAENTLLIAVDGDYTDAIEFGNSLCKINGITPEGGAKNPARRDGMGTAFLDGALFAGRIPDWYFQAVGSGTGAVAASEMAERLIEGGGYGDRMPRLYLSQNEGFSPMVSAWNDKRREIIPDPDMPNAKNSAINAYSPVLTNRTPPYSIRGGLFDALVKTDGVMAAVSANKAKEAGRLFEDLCGADIDRAAEVCLASLIDASEKGVIKKGESVLLNITGGGYNRAKEEYDIIKTEPFAQVRAGEGISEIEKDVLDWVKNHARG